MSESCTCQPDAPEFLDTLLCNYCIQWLLNVSEPTSPLHCEFCQLKMTQKMRRTCTNRQCLSMVCVDCINQHGECIRCDCFDMITAENP